MNLIFDLDGTLVNSAPGILDSLSYVIKAHNIDCPVTLSHALIGPPLREMLVKVSGSSEDIALREMERTFKAYYDETGVFETTLYEGIVQMLDGIKNNGHELFVATNKRAVPTLALMKYFSLEKYFLGIYSLDTFSLVVKDKASLLDKIVNMHLLIKKETIYIGDRPEDGEAATICGLNFMRATWGYGDVVENLSEVVLRFPNEIETYLK